MWAESELMDAGGLMSYGPNYADLFRRAANLCRQNLKRRQARRSPVEQPKKFEFIINLKDRQADRPDDSAERAGAGGQGHQMM